MAIHEVPLHELPLLGEQPWPGDRNAVVLYDYEAMTIHSQAYILLRFVRKTIYLNLVKY